VTCLFAGRLLLCQFRHSDPAELYERLACPALRPQLTCKTSTTRTAQGKPRGFAAAERFWQSVIPICQYEGWQLASLELHPIELNYHARHRSLRGEPRLADVETGTSILRQLERLSEPFGVRISVEVSGGHVVGKAG
jgi:poly-gamma-glutamate synthesis protein (capsule biosynthesis protein)